MPQACESVHPIGRLAFAALVFLASVPAEAGFATAVNYGVGGAPRSVAVGDFNGDGRQDLAVVNSGSNNVSILMGNGSGTFQAAVNYAVGSGPSSVALGDFNGDGQQDLAVVNSGSNNVSIRLGNGNGTFQAAVGYGVGSGPSSVARGDFNGDGQQDLAVANLNSGNVSILAGNGDGTFQMAVNHSVGSGPRSIIVADFNRDGNGDLAIANSGSNTVSILLGNGSGTFSAALNSAVGTGPWSVAGGDFNRDGKQDLVVGNVGSDNVSVMLGTGNGTFSAAVNYGAGTNPASVAVGDFDRDGRQDLAVGNDGSANVSVLSGNGNGTFNAALNYGVGTTPRFVAVGDFNGNGGQDLAVSNQGSNDVSVLINDASAAACTFQPAVNYPVGTGPASVAAADLDRDGKRDVAVANSSSNNVSILLNNGNGTFKPAVSYPAGSGPSAVVVGDFDRDGKPDLAVANSGSASVSILLGGGDGTFQEAVNYGASTGPASVAVGDFDQDGRPDLAVANSGSGNVSILLGNGDGTFQGASNYSAAAGPASVAVGDFNGDGKQDLAVANGPAANVSILIGNGDGSFQTPLNYTMGTGPSSVVVDDFDRQGSQDLAVANHGSGNASIRLGNGNGTFRAAVNYGTGTGPTSLAVGDFNGDGKPDLAVAKDASANVSILLGNGDGTFQPRVNYGAGTAPASVTAGDLNGNGRQDLAVANRGSNNVSILRCQPPPPGLSINDVGVPEGNSGLTNAVFTVHLSPSSSQTVTVNFATADGTATAGSDYTAVVGTVTFAPGVTAQTVSVPVIGDVADEDDETFFVNLTSPVNATIADGQGVGTILDDDPVSTISIGDCPRAEGNAGSASCSFGVSLSASSSRTITVHYATANGTATGGSDYTAVSGTVTFAPGVTAQTVSVPVIGDVVDEDDETFFVNLTSPVNATIADGQGVGTILDDDPAPAISIGDCARVEGNAGSVSCSFGVSLSAPSGRTITVNYATADGAATAGSDYTAVSGTLTFAPGVTAQAVSVPVIGDLLNEDDETFFVNLTSAVNATIADGQGVGTIVNDDPPPVLSIGDCGVMEENAGTVPCVFAVMLSRASGKTVTANHATADGTATGGSDYVTTSGGLTFTPGQTSKTVSVSVNGDAAVEGDETFFVDLGGVTNATVGDAQGLGTILDDDAPSLSSDELVHGAVQWADLAVQPGPVADVDLYRLGQDPLASYEVAVDAPSGDITPVIVERLSSDNVTVLQTGTAVGTGSGLSLRWENQVPAKVVGQHIRVRSGGCTTDCGIDDVYRIRAYETTYSIPRFNNAGSQITVLLLQNPTVYTITGHAHFWDGGGTLVYTQTFSLGPKGLYGLNTSTVPALQGKGGTITVSNDGRYGDLTGKATALEPATGFSFDSLMVSRPR